MTIEITSCSIPSIWYEKRIGQRFKATAKPGHKTHVHKNPLFVIHEQDYKVTSAPATVAYKYERVYDILSQQDLTISEIIEKYKVRYGHTEYDFVQKSISILRKLNLIKNTGLTRRSKIGYNQKVYTLNTAA